MLGMCWCPLSQEVRCTPQDIQVITTRCLLPPTAPPHIAHYRILLSHFNDLVIY